MTEKKKKENEQIKEEECEVCFQNIIRKNEDIWRENKEIKQMIILIQNIEKNLQLQKLYSKVDKNRLYIYSENNRVYDINAKNIQYDLVENYYKEKVNKKIECCSLQLCIQCKYEWYCKENCSVCQKEYKNFTEFRVLNTQIIKKKLNIIDKIPEIKEEKQEYSKLLRKYSVQDMDIRKGNKIEQDFYKNKGGLNIITFEKNQRTLQLQDPNKEVKEGENELLQKEIVKILYKKRIKNFFDGKQIREFKKNQEEVDIERLSEWEGDMQQYFQQNQGNYQRRNGRLIFSILLLFLIVIMGMLTIAILEMRRNINY